MASRLGKARVTNRRGKVAGVLVKSEIEDLLSQGKLIQGGDPSRVRGCSYDLTVGTIFWQEKVLSGQDTQVVIPPGGVVAILTKEELDLPDDMFATAFAINKMSSKGFLVLNPGHVDPGFKGALTVKALNVRKVSMTLEAGANIFTVIFQRLPIATKSFGPIADSRKARERDFNETIVETSPRTIFEMMVLDRDGPYPSREEVRSMLKDLERDGPFTTREQAKDLIKESRLVWWTFCFSIATFLVAAAALVFAVVAAYKSVYPSEPVTKPIQSSLIDSGQAPSQRPRYGPATMPTVVDSRDTEKKESQVLDGGKKHE